MAEKSGINSELSNGLLKNVFRELFRQIVGGIDPSGIIDELYSKSVLSHEEALKLRDKKSKHEKCRELLYTLQESGNQQAFLVLYEALKADSAANWLIDKVDETYKRLVDDKARKLQAESKTSPRKYKSC
jgi:DNA polymerase III delta prime subunit